MLYKKLIRLLLFVDQKLRKCRYVPIPFLHKFDYLVSFILKFIHKRIGYPTPDLVGEKISSDFGILLAHCPDIDFIDLCIEEAQEKGVKDMKTLTRLIDKSRIKRGEKQIWGNIVKTYKRNGKLVTESLPLESPDEVDELREKAGLGSLSDYLVVAEELFIKIHRKGTLKDE